MTDNKLPLLLLDDEADILKALTRVLRSEYQIVSFDNGHDALAYLAENPIALIISDMRMPEMDGAEFLEKARVIYPDSVRLLLTGYADIQSTVKAVNEGGIHTYLSKPWDNENLKLIVGKAAEFYRLTQEKAELTQQLSERAEQLDKMNAQLEEQNLRLENFNQELEEKISQRTQELQQTNKKLNHSLQLRNQTFQDILSMMTAIIQFRTGMESEQNERVASQSKLVATQLGLSSGIANQVYLCGLMHQIGLITDDKATNNTKPTVDEQMLATPYVNPVMGSEIISRIKRFAPLVEIVRHQDEHFDGTGKPDHLKGEEIPIGSRIIKVVKDYDYFVAAQRNPRRMHTKSAQRYLAEHAETLYDPMVVECFIKVITNVRLADEGVELCVSLSEIKPGTIIKRDIYLPNGSLMLTAGNQINATLLKKLLEIEETTNMPIAVYIG